METITVEKYKVGGYIFENKGMAERLDKILSENPDAVICPVCQGMGYVKGCSVKMVSDEIDGRSSYPTAIPSTNPCTRCKNGTLTKVVETKYV